MIKELKIKKVSVVMCTYNGQKYLREQLDTIINQTYPIWEIIIQDDCSNDNTINILQEYSNRYPNIRIYKNEVNIGYIKNFHSALKKTSGELIALSDQDDIWLLNKIELMVKLISDNLMAACAAKVLTENDEKMRTLPFENFNIYQRMLLPQTGSGCQIIFKRSLINYLDFGINCDHAFFLVSCATYENSIAVTDQELVIWRRHENTTSKRLQVVEKQNMMRIPGHKVLYCMYCLMLKKKSHTMEFYFNNRYLLLTSLYKELGGGERILQLIKIMQLIKDQTFWGYVKASILIHKNRNELFNYTGTNIKKNYTIISYIYRYWFNFRYDGF